MKKILLTLSIILTLFASGCTQEKTAASKDYLTTVDGQDITIHFDEGTRSAGKITSENGTYLFSYSFDGTFSVVYPNGYEYSQREINGIFTASWDFHESAEELGFIDGLGLEWAVSSASQVLSDNQKAFSPIISILLVGLGLFIIISPKSTWWISRGWMYKNVEPSDLAVVIYRIVGVVIAFTGLISFFA